MVPYVRKPVKLSNLDNKLLVSIDRMANEYLRKTHAKKMTKDDVSGLVNCAKLVHYLVKEQQEATAKLSEDELESQANAKTEK